MADQSRDSVYAHLTPLFVEMAALPPDHVRFSPPIALWCPYCRASFVGSVDLRSGRFVHGTCPVGRLDLEAIRALADREWFWARFLENLGLPGPTPATPRTPRVSLPSRRAAA